jgi:ABC-type uncharacterized transport system permease subunit
VDKFWFLGAVAIYGLSSTYSIFLWRKGFRRDDHLNYLALLVGFCIHSVAMLQRGFSFNRCPVSNLYEAIAFFLWTIVGCYLVVGLWPRLRFLGAFASPVLFCVGVFALFPELDSHGPQPDRMRGWLSFHAAVILLAYGAFGLGSIAGLMYLSQEHDLKFRKIRAMFALFPPIQRLERVMNRLLWLGLVLLTVGLLVGGATLRRGHDQYSLWDTKIIWSWVVWLLYLGLLVMRWRFAQGGRRFAWGVVGGFAFVLLTFWGTNLMSGIHQQ